ncbi:MAG: KEOPS complex subunit Pcc1 [Natronomonas sp.]
MRRATIRTAHDDPETVAAALSPDNTDEMSTTVDDGRVVTRIDRQSSGGLRTTADDYLRGLIVADRVAGGVSDGDGVIDDDAERAADDSTAYTNDDSNTRQ